MKAPPQQFLHQMRRLVSGGGAADLMAPKKLVSLLPPMKRLVCFCPVQLDIDDNCWDKKTSDGLNDCEIFSISAAVSDPYLSFATPLQSNATWMEQSLYIPKDFSLEGDSKQRVFWSNLPESQDDILMQVVEEYTDIGGVVFGLPIKMNHDNNNSNNINITHIRDVLRNEMTRESLDKSCDRLLPLRPFNLQCQIDDQLTLDEVLNRANEQPEMWEEVNLSLFLDTDLRNSRNHRKGIANHAATALNTFLWQVSGGWMNTFG